MSRSRADSFRTGLNVSALVSGAILAIFFLSVSSTRDLRARVAFVLQMPGDPTLELMLLLVLLAPSILALWFVRDLTLHSLGAAVLVGVAAIAAAAAGAFAWVPEVRSEAARTAITLAVAVALVVALVIKRRRYARRDAGLV